MKRPGLFIISSFVFSCSGFTSPQPQAPNWISTPLPPNQHKTKETPHVRRELLNPMSINVSSVGADERYFSQAYL